VSAASPDGRAARMGLPLVIAGSAAFCTSTMFSAMKPLLITRFIEQAGYSPSLAGLAAAMPFVGGVFAAFVLQAVLRRFEGGAALVWSAFGLTLIELGNAVWFAQPALLLAGQFVAGLFGGVLMGLVSGRIAVAPLPEQTFGVVDFVGVLLMSAMITLVGMAIAQAGLRGAFLAAAALSAVFALVVVVARRGDSTGVAQSAPQTALRIDWRAATIVAMGVTFVTFSGLGFAFMVTSARELGFGYEAASGRIGVILFFSASGCLAGGWCAARFGARPCLLAAFALCALGWYVAFTTPSQSVFLLALCPAIFALQFCFPVLLSLAGSHGEDGRLAGIAAPIIVSGFAWASILAGALVERWGLAALPLWAAIGMAACAAMLLAATSRKRVV
jgi:predicted MFS family arabinose efflux permease